MWYKSQTVGEKPNNIDSTSSKTTVYVRKDFVRTVNEDGNNVWDYLEKKVPKEDWITYTEIINKNESVSDLTDAVMELAELIGG